MIGLRRYFEAMRAVDQEALRVGKADVDRRLEGMNDLRSQIEKERGDYITVETYEARHQSLVNLVELNSQRLSAMDRTLASMQARLPAIGALITLLSAGLGAAMVHVLGG